MGWDAFAETKTGKTIKSAKIKKAFSDASDQLCLLVGCDGFLSHCALDCSGAGAALKEATGFGVYDEAGWSAEKVQLAKAKASWEEVEGCLSLIASAKVFLDLCAKHNLSIYFSW